MQMVAGTPALEGIINPPADKLLEVVHSKYVLVIMASKRARQINAYYAQLGEGLLEYVGPLVETRVQEKPLSIALREIAEGLLRAEPADTPPTLPPPACADAVCPRGRSGHRRIPVLRAAQAAD